MVCIALSAAEAWNC